MTITAGARSSAFTTAGAVATNASVVRWGANLGIAVIALLIFHAISLTSGRIGVNDGLGWDGVGYSRMITEGMSAGTPDTQARPLLVFVAKALYARGFSVISSFEIMNYVSGFVLYLCTVLLLERHGADARFRALVVWNVALCMATSKLFAFYPVLIDFGALALLTIAFYLATTDRHRLAGLACVLAVASREFGVAVALYGIHRSVRQRRPWAALAYLPSLAAILLIRWMVVPTGDERSTPLSLVDAISNLALWGSPSFVATFVYFTVTVFGGVSVLLWLRPRWSLSFLRQQPELATFLLVILGLTAVGNLDIWRYLLFAYPAAIVLIARYCQGFTADMTRRTLIAMTALTFMTQRPFERLYEAIYFRDWFPLYHLSDLAVAERGPVWAARVAAVALMMFAVRRSLSGEWRTASA